MLSSVMEWTGNELVPALRVIGQLTLNMLDSLPLPLLVVVFLALVASLRLSPPQPMPVLPSYSPPLFEKTRLSPLAHSPPTMAYFALARSPSGGPDPAVSPQYVAVVESRTGSPPRVGRRGSKRYVEAFRRSSSGKLNDIVEEKLEV